MSTADLASTVVPVHGAFVDASSWNGVIAELKAAGLDVVAPPNLLRGVGVDAAHLTGFVKALGRPVVLVAHSYAGAVISQTGSDASNVAGLVYVADTLARTQRPASLAAFGTAVTGTPAALEFPPRRSTTRSTRAAGHRPADRNRASNRDSRSAMPADVAGRSPPPRPPRARPEPTIPPR